VLPSNNPGDRDNWLNEVAIGGAIEDDIAYPNVTSNPEIGPAFVTLIKTVNVPPGWNGAPVLAIVLLRVSGLHTWRRGEGPSAPV